MLKPFCSFSLPGTVASFSAVAGRGGGATGASFMAPSLSGRPISGEPGGSGAAGVGGGGGGGAGGCCAEGGTAAGGGSGAAGVAAGAGAGAGVCCAKAGKATRVPSVPASSKARRPDNLNVMMSSLNAGLFSAASKIRRARPHRPTVSDFCHDGAIGGLTVLNFLGFKGGRAITRCSKDLHHARSLHLRRRPHADRPLRRVSRKSSHRRSRCRAAQGADGA